VNRSSLNNVSSDPLQWQVRIWNFLTFLVRVWLSGGTYAWGIFSFSPC
jgi:hypothetical protein